MISENGLCHYQEESAPAGPTLYNCSTPLVGCVVSVQRVDSVLDAQGNTEPPMHICEVKVYGVSTIGNLSNYLYNVMLVF